MLQNNPRVLRVTVPVNHRSCLIVVHVSGHVASIILTLASTFDKYHTSDIFYTMLAGVHHVALYRMHIHASILIERRTETILSDHLLVYNFPPTSKILSCNHPSHFSYMVICQFSFNHVGHRPIITTFYTEQYCASRFSCGR